MPANTRDHCTPWPQFEAHVIENLRAARHALATAHGMAVSDGFVVWGARLKEMAAEAKDLLESIEENQRRVLQESCR
jgi:hypothetical protein